MIRKRSGSERPMGSFDSISAFSAKYALVERRGAYNLVGEDGYVSDEWYAKITRVGEGADFEERKTRKVIQVADVSLLAHYKRLRKLVSSRETLDRLDVRNVAVIDPLEAVANGSERKVTLVAATAVFGKSLWLGNDGSLYALGSLERYELPAMTLSLTDLHRLEAAADETNFALKSDYAVLGKELAGTPMWIYCFLRDGLLFTTARKQTVEATCAKPECMDAVKVRFSMGMVPLRVKEKLSAFLDGLGYSSGASRVGNGCVWRTKGYGLDSLAKLHEDLGEIKKIACGAV